MTSSLRVIDNEGENRFAGAEIPLARPSLNKLVKPAARSCRTVQSDRLAEFTAQAFASFLEGAQHAVVVADRDGRLIRVNA